MLRTKRIRGIRLLIVLAVVAIALVGCGKEEQETKPNTNGVELGMEANEVVATYEGGEVKAGEFKKYLDFLSYYYYPDNEIILDQANWNEYLKMYVGQKIILERAEAKNVTVNADEWSRAYEQTKEAITGVLQNGLTYEGLLSSLNLTEQDIKDQIHEMMVFSEYFYTLKSDTELKQFYDENPEYFMLASVRHILISNEERSDEEAKALAEELANRIRAGEDFATLANEYTDDTGNVGQDNVLKGGLYENQPVSQWVEAFKNATMTLPLNQVSDPVKTEYGYHVMRVESRELVPFEQVKDAIAAQEGQSAYYDFLEEELDKLQIDSKLPKADQE